MLTYTEPTNQTFMNKNRMYIFLVAVFMIFTICYLFVVFRQTNAHENLIAEEHGLQNVIFGEEEKQRDLNCCMKGGHCSCGKCSRIYKKCVKK